MAAEAEAAAPHVMTPSPPPHSRVHVELGELRAKGPPRGLAAESDARRPCRSFVSRSEFEADPQCIHDRAWSLESRSVEAQAEEHRKSGQVVLLLWVLDGGGIDRAGRCDCEAASAAVSVVAFIRTVAGSSVREPVCVRSVLSQ